MDGWVGHYWHRGLYDIWIFVNSLYDGGLLLLFIYLSLLRVREWKMVMSYYGSYFESVHCEFLVE